MMLAPDTSEQPIGQLLQLVFILFYSFLFFSHSSFSLLFYLDSVKTDAQRAREKKLLEDLVQIVDKRDELVRHLDNQEKA